MITFDEPQKQAITPEGVMRDYLLREENLHIKCSNEVLWERICLQMAEEIAELRNS